MHKTEQALGLSEAMALAEQTRRNGHLAEAEIVYGYILQAVPEHPPALQGLGNLFAAQGQQALAAEYFCRATIADAPRVKSKAILGLSYAALGRQQEAANVYGQWLRDEPDNPIAAHFLAANTGENIPARASNRYIEKTFDDFAADFNDHLLQHLSYQVPQLLSELLASHVSAEKQLHTLDAGCGTGLCGTVLSPYACQLTGVDLSSGMLAVAQRTGIYDALIQDELTHFLDENREAFDLIVMADTLIYFGALTPVFAAVHSSLRSDGLYIFSVEIPVGSSATAHHLNSAGRYCHTEQHVLKCLAQCNLHLLSITPQTLRTEWGRPVAGLLVTARK